MITNIFFQYLFRNKKELFLVFLFSLLISSIIYFFSYIKIQKDKTNFYVVFELDLISYDENFNHTIAEVQAITNNIIDDFNVISKNNCLKNGKGASCDFFQLIRETQLLYNSNVLKNSFLDILKSLHQNFILNINSNISKNLINFKHTENTKYGFQNSYSISFYVENLPKDLNDELVIEIADKAQKILKKRHLDKINSRINYFKNLNYIGERMISSEKFYEQIEKIDLINQNFEKSFNEINLLKFASLEEYENINFKLIYSLLFFLISILIYVLYVLFRLKLPNLK